MVIFNSYVKLPEGRYPVQNKIFAGERFDIPIPKD